MTEAFKQGFVDTMQKIASDDYESGWGQAITGAGLGTLIAALSRSKEEREKETNKELVRKLLLGAAIGGAGGIGVGEISNSLRGNSTDFINSI